jgi:hypothetical protein
LNRGPPAPEAGALTGLRYAPCVARRECNRTGPVWQPSPALSSDPGRHTVKSVSRPDLLRSRRTLLGAGIALVLGIAAAIVVGRLREGPPDRNRVAVAVFVNRTGDPSLEPLGSMAADWVTRGLTQTALVDVVDVGALYVEGRNGHNGDTESAVGGAKP